MNFFEWWKQSLVCKMLFQDIYNVNNTVYFLQDEVAHTLTENRVLKLSKHPFLTVSCPKFNPAQQSCTRSISHHPIILQQIIILWCCSIFYRSESTVSTKRLNIMTSFCLVQPPRNYRSLVQQLGFEPQFGETYWWSRFSVQVPCPIITWVNCSYNVFALFLGAKRLISDER